MAQDRSKRTAPPSHWHDQVNQPEVLGPTPNDGLQPKSASVRLMLISHPKTLASGDCGSYALSNLSFSDNKSKMEGCGVSSAMQEKHHAAGFAELGGTQSK